MNYWNTISSNTKRKLTKERPSNEDLNNIWNHVLGIYKENFETMLKVLSFYIEDYLQKYKYQRYHHFRGRGRPICVDIKFHT
ncbi:hypothetical protein C923_03200 [Plasmodium falciparum UGT5.1]|uniref:Plasmodium RESA N-terminal domain-containing protein n=1 Tax=Plasmodium falciparum UGT5.1 TaxID=1237627 RepID=W7JB86_PLAFA|nr:hypothetical protein C923_03200 [Plasmodium falciparum UGT5.1]